MPYKKLEDHFRYYNRNQGKGQKKYGFLITKREIHLQTGKEVNKSGKFVYKMGLLDYKRNRWGENGILGLQMGILFCNSPV